VRYNKKRDFAAVNLWCSRWFACEDGAESPSACYGDAAAGVLFPSLSVGAVWLAAVVCLACTRCHCEGQG
jgi:hypothetical protein